MADTRDRILEIARALVREGGPQALSFDAIAERLGKSKQAVLYWLPNKGALLSALYLPWLAAESEAAEAALAGVEGEAEAVAAFVRAVAAFHLADLERFRLTYLAPQLASLRVEAGTLGEINATTGRLYAALAARLEGEDARTRALAVHSAVIGLVTMVTLADALGDPLKAGTEALVEALVATLA